MIKFVQVLKMSDNDISAYLQLIPVRNHHKLDKELDYNNDIDRDLIDISQYIIGWKEKLKSRLGMTKFDVYRINQVDAALRQ